VNSFETAGLIGGLWAAVAATFRTCQSLLDEQVSHRYQYVYNMSKLLILLLIVA
jgi:hypothetical protein